ncbi:DedA family protein [Desulforegula conservatrix]|uniref:DedA family protein n=1 Tax=Desulforegula conservatrix TaxID=153026 RepID=UPI00041E02DF|nr:DedA family protein [Desulforegula conservatrix]
MDFHALIRDYGYWAVLIGTFLEGETILILGGVAAQSGSLELAFVMLSAFAGSSCGDQLYYFIGRWQGRALLLRFPRWSRAAAKVSKHVKRHQNFIILCFRFFYGLRNVTPFVLGISHVRVPRFVILNLIGAGIWSISFASLGFLLGEAHERALGKGYSWVLIVIVLILGLIYWGYRRWKDSREPYQPPETLDIPILDENIIRKKKQG